MTGADERVKRVALPDRIADGFAPDYGDCFRTVSPVHVDARHWASESLRGAEGGGGVFSRIVWHGLLGFELAPSGSPGTLVGWSVRLDTSRRFELETDGSLMAGRMVFLVGGGEVSWATLLRFHRSRGRVIWAAAGHVHRAVTPRCLHSAGQALTRTSVTT